jgi:hypothetical protein
MERAHIETTRGNATASLSAFVGALALAAGPAGLLAARFSTKVSLHIGIAVGGGAAALLAILALLLARHGRLRAERNISGAGAGSARAGRTLGTLALCIGIAAGIALLTDAVLTHFRQ